MPLKSVFSPAHTKIAFMPHECKIKSNKTRNNREVLHDLVTESRCESAIRSAEPSALLHHENQNYFSIVVTINK